MPLLPAEPWCYPPDLMVGPDPSENGTWWVLHTKPRAEKAIARSLHMDVSLAHLAIVVPLSLIVQMAPVSINGLGLRETTFVVYFTPLGVPPESAFALSFIGYMLMMVLSISGAIVYLARRK